MICCQFIFKPGTYDDDFHRLDGEIDAYARSLPGFDRAETCAAFAAPFREHGLVRLAIGLEAKEDLIADLDASLTTAYGSAH